MGVERCGRGLPPGRHRPRLDDRKRIDRAVDAVSQPRALARYVLAWLWFLPALASLYIAEIQSLAVIWAVLLVGVLAYAGLSRLHPQRQFWHDAACGTRLVTSQPTPPERR